MAVIVPLRQGFSTIFSNAAALSKLIGSHLLDGAVATTPDESSERSVESTTWASAGGAVDASNCIATVELSAAAAATREPFKAPT